MGSVLDDIESRPGSTTSLLRTIVGLYLRRLGGHISVAHLVQLMADLGISDNLTRTAVARLKRRGLLIGERGPVIGYRLDPAALPMMERGDRRIFDVRAMAIDDPWCLVSFSIPESSRDLRHQLRRRLRWIGCGRVSQALWICPEYLAPEVEEILNDLNLARFATTFRADRARVAGSLPDAVAEWWDLDALRQEHLEFLEAVTKHDLNLDDDPEPREAYIRYVNLIDRWRVIPYIDPGLPSQLLPSGWPGERSIPLFLNRSARLAEPAWLHVAAAVGAPAHP